MKPNHTNLLNKLRENSRKDITKISKEINIPISTAFSIKKQLEKNIIRKYTTILNLNKIGNFIRIFLLTASNHQITNFLKNNPKTNNIMKISGTYNIIAEIILKNQNDLENFLEEIKRFKTKKQVLYIIEDIKKESFKLPP